MPVFVLFYNHKLGPGIITAASDEDALAQFSKHWSIPRDQISVVPGMGARIVTLLPLWSQDFSGSITITKQIVWGEQVPWWDDPYYIESFGSFCCVLHEEMAKEKDKDWPKHYRYHVFDGFPGWWNYVSACARIFVEVVKELRDHFGTEKEPEWIEVVDGAASTVMFCIKARPGPIEPNVIREALRRALYHRYEQASL